MKKPTQCDKIMLHLKKYGKISTFEAFSHYNITRLNSRIFDLRQLGYDIETRYQTKKNALGETITYAEYILKEWEK